mmetsp:Transcript_5742/g.11446  ORF Transcript_5742/g.11446 Transcript_5742/m.11446 type:complete len:249 (-) Transcript_5742:238-984(-)|eukprot:CAMPEP_0180620092 /NCGR_PEP_ID=MMETSP1037_2-20121125/34432_1 /TAXON_ID=632150 /ORGANISM="Azadinium spinosum, Strain 3D9" /LENGTH=248 /DNA_ID=CAMNT_0022640181 /DNA_START=201 /DNA_END=947 /DNA_ORIENTATION=+
MEHHSILDINIARLADDGDSSKQAVGATTFCSQGLDVSSTTELASRNHPQAVLSSAVKQRQMEREAASADVKPRLAPSIIPSCARILVPCGACAHTSGLVPQGLCEGGKVWPIDRLNHTHQLGVPIDPEGRVHVRQRSCDVLGYELRCSQGQGWFAHLHLVPPLCLAAIEIIDAETCASHRVTQRLDEVVDLRLLHRPAVLVKETPLCHRCILPESFKLIANLLQLRIGDHAFENIEAVPPVSLEDVR